MKIKEKQKLAREWFSTLQNIICKNTELLEKNMVRMLNLKRINGNMVNIEL